MIKELIERIIKRNKDIQLNKSDFENQDKIKGISAQNMPYLNKDNLTRDFFTINGRGSPLGGSTPKLSLKCNIKHFKELINELNKPDCSYVVYFEDLIKNKGYNINNLPLQNIDVFVKMAHDDERWENEETTSKIANIFGLPTVYNKSIIVDDIKLIMSVNCLKDGEQFIQFDYPTGWVGNFETVRNILKNNLKDDISSTFTEEDLENLIKDYVETYLFRNYVLNDRDYTAQNISPVKNTKTGKIYWSADYDYEYALEGAPEKSTLIINDLAYINNLYPDKLKSVMKKFYSLIESPKFDQLGKNKDKLNQNLVRLTNCYKQMMFDLTKRYTTMEQL